MHITSEITTFSDHELANELIEATINGDETLREELQKQISYRFSLFARKEARLKGLLDELEERGIDT